MSEYFRKPIVKTLMLKGKDAVSISDIEKKSTSGLTDTYEITLTDGTKKSFKVSNGKGIKSIAKTSTSGLVDTYTTTYNDGTTSTFTVKNGEKGDTGSVENLKIGGVNLLNDTKNINNLSIWINTKYWDIKKEKYNGFTIITNKNNSNEGITQELYAKAGEKYTYSVYAKKTSDFDGSAIMYCTNNKLVNKTLALKEEFERYFFHIEATNDGYIRPQIATRNSTTGKIEVCGFKLEREEIPTDWTPSLEDIENEIASAKDILNKTYPVGSIYMSVNSTNPSSLFGGTWARLEGRFLIGAGTNMKTNTNGKYGDLGVGEPEFANGETGGQYYHKLGIDEMPEHNHDTNDWTIVANKDGVRILTDFGAKCISTPETTNIVPNIKSTKNEDGNATGDAGGGKAHNNMPPYLAVYMWKRTA